MINLTLAKLLYTPYMLVNAVVEKPGVTMLSALTAGR
jgi:hypothetical protein